MFWLSSFPAMECYPIILWYTCIKASFYFFWMVWLYFQIFTHKYVLLSIQQYFRDVETLPMDLPKDKLFARSYLQQHTCLECLTLRRWWAVRERPMVLHYSYINVVTYQASSIWKFTLPSEWLILSCAKVCCSVSVWITNFNIPGLGVSI